MKVCIRLALFLCCAVTSLGPGSEVLARAEETPVKKQSGGPIIPGESAGPLRLGASHSDIVELLGTPSAVRERSAGISEAEWDFTPPEADTVPENFQTDLVYIIYAGDKAIQIGVTSPRYAAPGGYTTRHTLGQIFRRFKNLTRSSYGIEAEEGGGYLAYFYDNVQAGLAFMIGVQDDFDNTATPTYIFVHRRGKPVMPERNATLVDGSGNIPAHTTTQAAAGPSNMTAAERREKLLVGQYLERASQIYIDSMPMLKNLRNYAIRESQGNPPPRAAWKTTLDNLEANVRRYKAIKLVPTTMKKGHSYAIEYAVNSIHYINYARAWMRTGEKRYITLSQPYMDAAGEYAELMMREYERTVKKIR